VTLSNGFIHICAIPHCVAISITDVAVDIVSYFHKARLGSRVHLIARAGKIDRDFVDNL
jgi:hypothetical protein